MSEMQIEYWSLERLVHYAGNPRKNDHAVEQAAEAIREFGFRVPVVIRGEGEVIDGHLRLKAARHLGLLEVPVVRADKPLKNEEHPTIKPVEIPKRAILNSSKNGDRVLDLFLGSGTTLIAAEQSGRVCYGLELDPKYCDVIVRRWEKFTGRKAELV